MQIQTERLIIRDYQQTDLEDIHEYGSDPEVLLEKGYFHCNVIQGANIELTKQGN